MKFLAFFLVTTSLLWYNSPTAKDCNVLRAHDKCHYYETVTVCIQDIAFSKNDDKYKELTMELNEIKNSNCNKKLSKWRPDATNILYFTFRTEGSKMFYLTSLVRDIIPSQCDVKEVILFCLTDSIGTTRTISKGSCESAITSILLKKERISLDTLTTYGLNYPTVSFDGPHLVSITLNKNLIIKRIGYYTRGMILPPCESDSILFFD